MPPLVALATCTDWPELDDDSAPLVAALGELDVDARVAIWDDASVEWNSFDLVVVRCTWDYVGRHQEFVAWARSVPRLVNPGSIVGWNTDKHYLSDLVRAGVPTVETVFVEPPGDGRASLTDRFADRELVVKPAVSAGARDTARYRPEQLDAAAQHIDEVLASGRTVMVQPYLASVDQAGETAMVFFGGSYSHAISKAAQLTGPERHVEAVWRPETFSPRRPTDDEHRLADQALAAVSSLVDGGHDLAYARVDMVRDDHGDPVVLELELTEPFLFLGFAPGSVERFAQVLAARVGTEAVRRPGLPDRG